MTMSLPASIWPKVSALSLPLRDMRNQSTSIGAPSRRSSSPAFSRTVEWRPSQPTTSRRGSSSVPSGVFARTPDDAAALLDQVGRLGLHAQVERRVAPGLLGQEIEEIPLRHQGDEFAARRQMAEIRHREALRADLTGQRLDLLMRQLQELVEQAQFVHQLERRWMDRVAAEIAEEIRVLLQHHDVDAGAREQKAQHHSRGAAAGDAALR